jgi:hypothetical protein
MPAAHQRSAICQSRQCLTFSACSRQIPIIDSIAFVDRSVRARVGGARSRCIAMRHEILAAASSCDAVNVDLVANAPDTGAYRTVVSTDFAQARPTGVPCSGTLVLPDGRMLCNPGTRTGWIGGKLPRGTPILLADHPHDYDRIIADVLATHAVPVSACP